MLDMSDPGKANLEMITLSVFAVPGRPNGFMATCSTNIRHLHALAPMISLLLLLDYVALRSSK
jgi:hypothetical protein